MTTRTAPSAHPYDTLDPHAVLSALEQLGFAVDGRLLQLNSYENRVYQVNLDDNSVIVAKFYRPGRWSDAQILEEHAFALALQAAEAPVVAPLVLSAAAAPCVGAPPTLAHVQVEGQDHRVAVSPRRVGRGPELEDPATLTWLGRFLGRMHSVAGASRFEHRRSLSPAWGRDAVVRVLDAGFIDDAQRHAWQATCEQALALVQTAFDALPTLQTLRLHGDFHPGNVMWREKSSPQAPAAPAPEGRSQSWGGPATGGPHVVDLDDACNGPAVQDLWMLLSGDAIAMREQLGHLLDGYRVFRPFDTRELALVEPLRTLRMICHSAWIAERWSDPAFPIAFPWYGGSAYWSQQTTQLREQIALMQEPIKLA
jgi:Ser/Thr protein kinase RdoA (MazF antagonist)